MNCFLCYYLYKIKKIIKEECKLPGHIDYHEELLREQYYNSYSDY